MLTSKTRDAIRVVARSYEQTLPPDRRKRLGQYFTGIPLGKVLAHLALDPNTRTVLDPMSGHGDLLDATWEAATERDIPIQRLDGIEIDEATAQACRDRLDQIAGSGLEPVRKIINADAFDPVSIRALPLQTYDLVISNPPYVRYQSQKAKGSKSTTIRDGLKAVLAGQLSDEEARTWGALADGYSGLADLSVPAWILAAMMVQPGGRLALVVPATWRSRDYADVIRYLMLRCFALEWVVEDRQPGWFSDALVRTHLIIARRLSALESAKTIEARHGLPNPLWIQVSPEASSAGSLVGTACPGARPEKAFAAWLQARCPSTRLGITVQPFDPMGEYISLERCVGHRRWFRSIPDETGHLPLFDGVRSGDTPIVPRVLADIFQSTRLPNALLNLEDAGIVVGQGLRTGCNTFFYVTACDSAGPEETLIEVSPLFGARRFVVPNATLRPVLRGQSETGSLEACRLPRGRVLDLRRWVLPEDKETVLAARQAYAAKGEAPPQLMPKELAAHVRLAAITSIERDGKVKLIPELSAVRTNVRLPRDTRVIPRFWYMLPEFAPRHLPAVFIPRINHNLPWVESNLDPPVLIDANFATLRVSFGNWTRYALKALLNSVWCRVAMEALGTPMGGGALKLEATHLRRLPVPALSDSEKDELDSVGKRLARGSSCVHALADTIVLGAIIAELDTAQSLGELAKALEKRALVLSAGRRRTV